MDETRKYEFENEETEYVTENDNEGEVTQEEIKYLTDNEDNAGVQNINKYENQEAESKVENENRDQLKYSIDEEDVEYLLNDKSKNMNKFINNDENYLNDKELNVEDGPENQSLHNNIGFEDYKETEPEYEDVRKELEQNYQDININEEQNHDYNREVAMDTTRWEKSKRSVKRSRRSGLGSIIISAVLASAITLGGVYALLPNILNARGIKLDNTLPQQQITINPAEDHTVYSAVAKKAMPSVVGITTIGVQRDWLGLREVTGVGTGVVIDKRGYILTNSHVISDGNAKEVKVLLNDGGQIDAEVLWFEKSLDLAIIKVEGGNLPVAELGDSDEIEVGQLAIAIGNPLGLSFQRTLTQGVISGLNRSITDSGSGTTIENLIQTDASINPGNSGGPLLNSRGQVIGINTAKVTSGEGLGFAIPINTAKPIVEQFIEKGEFTRVSLGIQAIDIDMFESLTGLKLPVEKGVYVAQVTGNSAADKYGIMAGDIIVKVGNAEINNRDDLIRTTYKHRPGDKTSITVLRNNKAIDINMVFD